MTKLGDDVIAFLKGLGIPEEQWEEYLKRNSNLIPSSKKQDKKFPIKLCFKPTSSIQNFLNDLSSNTEMVLYMVSILKGLSISNKIIERDDENYGWIIDNSELDSYELRYIRKYDDTEDIIVYSKTRNNTLNSIFFYRFNKNGILVMRTLKNKTWKTMPTGMIDYVIQMFAGFREQGITFTNNTINEITDNFIKTRRPKTLERTKNIKE